MNRRSFIRTLIGAAVAPLVPAALVPLPEFGFCPPGEWAISRMTAEEAALLATRYRWEADLAKKMLELAGKEGPDFYLHLAGYRETKT